MNARLKRLGFNSIWMSLSRLGAQGLGVAFIVLLGRGLGSAGFGEYAFLAAVLTTGNALTTFGTDMHLIRQIAGEGKLSGLGEALAIQLGLSLLFIAGVSAAAPGLPNLGAEGALAGLFPNAAAGGSKGTRGAFSHGIPGQNLKVR